MSYKRLFVAFFGFAYACFSVAQTAWPDISVPQGAKKFSVGDNMVFNGVPMHISGFISEMPREKMVEWYKEKMSQPIVENTYGRQRLLGKAYGDYYVTIQMDEIGGHTNVVIAIADMQSARSSMQENQAITESWLTRLPDGTQILSRLTSMERGKNSLHLTFSNAYSEQKNRDQLAIALKRDGLMLERETVSGEKARTLYFRGNKKEAMATIAANNNGQTIVVLNTISVMEKN